MNNRMYAQMLMIALIGSFSDMKAQNVGQGISSGSQSIPLLDDTLSGDERAIFEGEPGLDFPSSNKKRYDAHNIQPYNSSGSIVGGDTASRPPVNLVTNIIPSKSDQNMLGRTPDSRPPLNINEQNSVSVKKFFADNSNMDDIKKPEFTDENILEKLADMFKEEPQLLNEPVLDTSVQDYLDQLNQQIEILNDELEKTLSRTRLNELAEKCPLLIDPYVNTSSADYPDLMHSGGYINAPDMGEIKPIQDISQ